jgi:hypothetical protein
LLFNWRNKKAPKLSLLGKGAAGRRWSKNSHVEISSCFSEHSRAYLSGTTVLTPELVEIFYDLFSPAMYGKNMLKTSCLNVTRQA